MMHALHKGLFFRFITIFVVYLHLYVLYFVLDFLFVFCFTRLCAFIILFHIIHLFSF